MKGLDTISLNGKAVKIKLKDGKKIVGTLPVHSNNEELEKNYLAFLPWHKNADFKKYISGKQPPTNQGINQFLNFIKRTDIESFELMENELNGIYIENGKPVPNWLEVLVQPSSIPGHVSVKYRIPGNIKLFDLGSLQIRNAKVHLPLTLVFLSYAKEDKKTVKSVMNNLHNMGVLTWFDEKDLLPGDDWESRIEEAIEKSDYVLVFLSSTTLDKVGYKNKEIKYALDQHTLRPSGKRYIIPILIDDCKPPREFHRIQWLKMTENEWYEKLLASIGKQPNGKVI
jgi:hypothetical protein